MRPTTTFKGILAACLLLVCARPLPATQTDALYILTTNDLHGQVEPLVMSDNGSAVEQGGLARLAGAIETLRRQHPGQVLAVSSGDFLTGPYFLQFAGAAIFSGLSLAGIDVAALGNHDFDEGPAALATALKYCTFPVVATNITLAEASPLHGMLLPHTIIERSGLRIGVIGLMTPDLPILTRPLPGLTVRDPAAAAREAIAVLKQQGADLILALTHLGLDEDRALARAVPAIDIICGGHTHDLVAPGREVRVPRPDAATAVIVQAGARARYLGMLRADRADNQTTGYTWDLIALREHITPHDRVAKLITTYTDRMPPAQVLTRSTTDIDCRSATLWSGEAAIGNLLCDILRARLQADIALYNGGGIRGDRILPAGAITTADLTALLPFGNRATVLTLSGADIRRMLEHGAEKLPRPSGRFLQVSGLRLHIDITRQPGLRVTAAQVQRPDGSWSPLQPDRDYRVVTNSFLTAGGDAYPDQRARAVLATNRRLVRQIVADHLAGRDTITPLTDGRIRIGSSPP